MKAVNFLNLGVTFKMLTELIQLWEDWRCADGAEDVYDLEDEKDFKLFIDKYGIEETIKFYKKNRFYLDGMNFNAPITITNEFAINMINDVYDKEHLKELRNNGWLDCENSPYREYFDMRKLIEGYLA